MSLTETCFYSRLYSQHFCSFLYQMKTLKFASEIYWPLKMANVIYLWKIFLISISDWQKIPFIFFKNDGWSLKSYLFPLGLNFLSRSDISFFIWCLHGRSKQYYDLSILNPVEFSKEKERNAVSQRDTWTFSPQNTPLWHTRG